MTPRTSLHLLAPLATQPCANAGTRASPWCSLPLHEAESPRAKISMSRKLSAADSLRDLLQAQALPATTSLGCPPYCHNSGCPFGATVSLAVTATSSKLCEVAPLTMAVPRTAVVLQPRAATARPLICSVSRRCNIYSKSETLQTTTTAMDSAAATDAVQVSAVQQMQRFL